MFIQRGATASYYRSINHASSHMEQVSSGYPMRRPIENGNRSLKDVLNRKQNEKNTEETNETCVDQNLSRGDVHRE